MENHTEMKKNELYCNLDEFPKHNVEWEKLDTKEYVQDVFIYKPIKQAKFIYTNRN